MEIIESLGSAIDREWKQAHYQTAAFPRIASALLAEARLHEHVGLRELTNWLSDGRPLPVQSNGDFGDAQIHLFNRPRWYIEALLWHSGRTGIHEHAFSGAFCVVEGRSFQAAYEFVEETRVHNCFLLGHMSVARTELLEPGAVQTIQSGERFSHAVVHLESPTISIVARTINDALARDQFGYEPPFLLRHRIGPFLSEETTRLRTLRFLHRVAPAHAAEFAARLIAHADVESAFDILRDVLLVDTGAFGDLYTRAERRIGEPMPKLRQVLLETVRRFHLSTALADTRLRWQQRLLLSLIATHTSSRAVVDDLERLLPSDDPGGLLKSLLDEMAALNLNALTTEALDRVRSHASGRGRVAGSGATVLG